MHGPIWMDINILFITQMPMSQLCLRGISNGSQINIRSVERENVLCLCMMCGLLTGAHRRRSSAQSGWGLGNSSYACSFFVRRCAHTHTHWQRFQVREWYYLPARGRSQCRPKCVHYLARTKPFTITFLNGGFPNRAVESTSNV